MSAAVEAIDLAKTYAGGVEAVRGISFTVPEGECFGLLGPNGAGKSTTIGMLTTSVTPTRGRALLGGIDVAQDPIGARAISSVVFQDPAVDRALTGRQNLRLHLRLWGVDRETGLRRLDDLAAAGGIEAILARPVSTYSGGQRRRLEIVRALLSSPRVLFMDEPTVGLDTRIRHDLFDAVATLRDATGVTIIMTTHDLDEAERLCDRLAIVDTGRIVACDTPANLLASVGPEVLEVRVGDPSRAVGALSRMGITPADVVVIGATVTAALRSAGGQAALQALDAAGVAVRSATTRPPTLDDVYLRLTGGRIDQAA